MKIKISNSNPSRDILYRLFPTFLLLVVTISFNQVFSQGLDSIFVEKYYKASASDASLDPNLDEGAITYRIYVDLKPGYLLNAVYGNSKHEMYIETTTEFYNQSISGITYGEQLNLGFLSVAPALLLDSYLSVGAGATGHRALPKSLDPNGSKPEISGTFTNNDPDIDLPLLTSADGLVDSVPQTTTELGLDVSMFSGTSNSSTRFYTKNGSFASLAGAKGATPENVVLLAQITTTGDLSFKLNIQLKPEGVGEVLNYVADSAKADEIQYPYLSYPTPVIYGCTNSQACNFDPLANNDDSTCIVPVPNCTQCNGSSLELIDDDMDGICNADEVAGCTDNTACNFDPLATDDDGSCNIPVTDCSECSGDTLLLIDYDKDGICNLNDTEGCTNPESCNYNPYATTDDGSCVDSLYNCIVCLPEGKWDTVDVNNNAIPDCQEVDGCTNIQACNYNPSAINDDGSCQVPVPGCTECAGLDTVMVDTIPTGGNGIRDCDDVGGCMIDTACNYDPLATWDDGSCLVPLAGCYVCNGSDMDTIDVSPVGGNGVPDCLDKEGCTISNACNYDPAATIDDGTCIVPVSNCTECVGDTLAMIDKDKDGIMDCNDTVGCTNPDACNYDPIATKDDGTCLVPEPGCTKCVLGSLEIIDTDGNEIADCDDIYGCTNPIACNYDPLATISDASCLVPVANCTECDGDTVKLIDDDGNGTCNADEPGLEDIIVEIYYIADSNDAKDEDGVDLKQGAITYRIFADLRPEFSFIGMKANSTHPLIIRTTTEFYNNEDRGQQFANSISSNKVADNTVALDSWMTIAGASNGHIAIPKADDTDGSILGAGDFLQNDHPSIGIPLTTADGLMEGTPPPLTILPSDLDLPMLGFTNSASQIELTSGASWAILGGYQSPDPGNKILLAQITTDGELYFELNFDIIDTAAGSKNESYVAKNPDSDEIEHAGLIYSSMPGCTSSTACNHDPLATVDNGMCLEPVANCYECSGDELVPVDTNNNGIADCEEGNMINESLVTFNLYPNPANDQIKITFSNHVLIESASIIDFTGRIHGTYSREDLAQAINVSDLPAGLYIFKVTNNTGITGYKQFVKH